MQQFTEKLHESSIPKGHILSSRGGVAMNEDVQLQDSEQAKEIRQIEGKCGIITVFKPSRQIAETDEDIHSLIARVLLIKQKRLQAAGE
ncbi:hypothetical protein [Virgibacillus sp. SK37]|uniref:hypothetical protein n=1 Tax=Virgibacillus sp. SK37 TaxID=403957 RepID=UPI0004D1EA6B|nr:hypothetical protein [Virgibacillus sp. SK37]AIF45633.1 hypothetical protein X953_18740 [Virgibacillus sp. SK37]